MPRVRESRVFQLAAGGMIAPSLGFVAHSVRVDNPGGQWLNFNGSPGVVAPFTIGVVVNLASPSQSPLVTTTPPAGQVNSGSGTAASLVFSSEDAAPVSGLAIGGGSVVGSVVAVNNTFSANVAPGRSLVAFVSSQTVAATTLTDAAGDVWVLIGTAASAGGVRIGWFLCFSCAAITAGQALTPAHAGDKVDVVTAGIGATIGASATGSANAAASFSVGPTSVSAANLYLAASTSQFGAYPPYPPGSPFTLLQTGITGSVGNTSNASIGAISGAQTPITAAFTSVGGSQGVGVILPITAS